ncbi:MAG: MFS transporter [Bacteroidota bacterium]
MNSITISPKNYRIAIAVFFFIAGLCFASWASRIPDIKHHLGLSDGQLGLILFAMPVGTMFSLPFTGWIISKLGSRTILLFAAFFYPSTLVMIGLVQQPWHLALALFFFGSFGNFFNISVNTQAIAVEQMYGKTIMASFHGIWSLAGFTGAALGTLIIALKLNPLIHFLIIYILDAGLVIYFSQATVRDSKGGASASFFTKPDRFILIYGLIAFGSMVCEGTMFDWSGVYFQKIVQAPPQLVTLGYLLFMGMMASGRFVSDRITHRVGIKTVLIASGICITSGLLIAVIFPFILTAGFGFMLVGLGVSSVVPLVYSAAGKSKTMSPGAALAAISTIGFIGFLLGPPLIGTIAEYSSLRWSFTLIAILGFSITVLASRVKW